MILDPKRAVGRGCRMLAGVSLSSTAEDMTKREVSVVPGPGNSVFSALAGGYDFDSGHGFVDAVVSTLAVPRGSDVQGRTYT